MNILDSIQPIKQGNLSDEIILRIQDLIKNESLKPGDRLPTEFELAEKFGVGRSGGNSLVPILPSSHRHISLNCYTAPLEPLRYQR